jgi:hypothetical protein
MASSMADSSASASVSVEAAGDVSAVRLRRFGAPLIGHIGAVIWGPWGRSPSGEAGNGDQLIMIDDPKIATAYAIEAVRVFDHPQFRDRMRGAFGAQRQRLAKATAPKRITLQKPTVISGADDAWRDRFYKPDTQAFRDRVVFST